MSYPAFSAYLYIVLHRSGRFFRFEQKADILVELTVDRSASALALDGGRRTRAKGRVVRSKRFFSVFFPYSGGREESIPARISANGEGVDFI